jgi:phage baseplate assembly protein W
MIIFGISGPSSQNLLTNLGGVRRLTSINKFHDNLKVLLETKKGTQIGDPAFGSNLCDLLYEPANEITAALIRQEVASTVESYYTNVTIQSVDIKFKELTIQISITYNIVNTNVGDTVMLEFIRAS